MKPIDLVVSYVNSLDIDWQKQFIDTINKYKGLLVGYTANRFRDFNTFRYFFRAVEENIPWIRKVFVVLQTPSQKPEWLQEGPKLKCVYHNEFIPQEYLPTYNSATIELFLWKIRGLSEHYIYFNDDMFVLNPLKESDFFDDNNNPVLSFKTIEDKPQNYSSMLKNTEILARVAAKAFDDCDADSWISDGHGCTPMKRSTWKFLFKTLEQNIKASLTQFRNPNNIVQQLSTYYFRFKRRFSEKQYSILTTDFSSFKASSIANMIESRSYDVICINDSDCMNYVEDSKIICNALNSRFPNKSMFEI